MLLRKHEKIYFQHTSTLKRRRFGSSLNIAHISYLGCWRSGHAKTHGIFSQNIDLFARAFPALAWEEIITYLCTCSIFRYKLTQSLIYNIIIQITQKKFSEHLLIFIARRQYTCIYLVIQK